MKEPKAKRLSVNKDILLAFSINHCDPQSFFFPWQTASLCRPLKYFSQSSISLGLEGDKRSCCPQTVILSLLTKKFDFCLSKHPTAFVIHWPSDHSLSFFENFRSWLTFTLFYNSSHNSWWFQYIRRWFFH